MAIIAAANQNDGDEADHTAQDPLSDPHDQSGNFPILPIPEYDLPGQHLLNTSLPENLSKVARGPGSVIDPVLTGSHTYSATNSLPSTTYAQFTQGLLQNQGNSTQGKQPTKGKKKKPETITSDLESKLMNYMDQTQTNIAMLNANYQALAGNMATIQSWLQIPGTQMGMPSLLAPQSTATQPSVQQIPASNSQAGSTNQPLNIPPHSGSGNWNGISNTSPQTIPIFNNPSQGGGGVGNVACPVTNNLQGLGQFSSNYLNFCNLHSSQPAPGANTGQAGLSQATPNTPAGSLPVSQGSLAPGSSGCNIINFQQPTSSSQNCPGSMGGPASLGHSSSFGVSPAGSGLNSGCRMTTSVHNSVLNPSTRSFFDIHNLSAMPGFQAGLGASHLTNANNNVHNANPMVHQQPNPLCNGCQLHQSHNNQVALIQGYNTANIPNAGWVEERKVISGGMPLGWNVAPELKDAIWNDAFIEFGDLIAKEASEQQTVTVDSEKGTSVCVKRKRQAVTSIRDWDLAFTTYTNVYLMKPGNFKHTIHLTTYGQEIKNMASLGINFVEYDASFRRERASQAAAGMEPWNWNVFRLETYNRLQSEAIFQKLHIQPKRWLNEQPKLAQSVSQPRSNDLKVPLGFCYEFHNTGKKCNDECSYRHVCHCGRGTHSLSICRSGGKPPKRGGRGFGRGKARRQDADANKPQ